MYSELYRYFLENKELPLPGIGTFLLERKPARVDFPNKIINPPSYSVSMQAGSYVPGQGFFKWLAAALSIADREAVFRFNDFVFDLKRQICEGAVVNWDGMGTMKKGLSGEVKFIPSNEEIVLEKPVPAEKVIRRKAEHMVRVGEDEKTSDEMTEMLNRPEEKKSYGWVWTLALVLLSVIFIGWHFSSQGLDTEASANMKGLSPVEAGTTHRLLP